MLVALVAVALVGCSRAPNGGALIALDDSDVIVCSPADQEGRAAFGVSAVQNESGDAIEVVGAQLLGADAMDLIGLELRAIDDPDAMVVGPDSDQYGPLTLAVPAAVAAGETRTTLVGVQVPAELGGSAESLELSFRAGDGSQGTAVTRIAMHVVPHGDVCRMEEIG